jgi:hypothetical protein
VQAVQHGQSMRWQSASSVSSSQSSTGPVKLLCCRLRELKAVKLPKNGRTPLRLFPDRSSVTNKRVQSLEMQGMHGLYAEWNFLHLPKLAKVDISSGIMPSSMLSGSSSLERERICPIWLGIAPVKPFCPAENTARRSIVPSSDGISPLSMFVDTTHDSAQRRRGGGIVRNRESIER